MNKILIALFAASLSLSASANTPQEAAKAFHQALKQGDSNQAAAALSQNCVIYESGYAERSKDEYMKHHLGDDAVFAAATERKVLRQQATVEGNLAVVMEETETTGSFKGKPVHLFGTETLVLQQLNGKWMITHAHWSSRKPK